MSFIAAALIGGGVALVGGMMQGSAAKSAAGTQAAAADRAGELQQQQYEQTRQDQMPWMKAGEAALNQLAPMVANYQKFGQAQFQQDPGYAFRLSEGSKALDRQAAARGGLISGGALKAAQRYGQEMGSQEYTNAFNRYQTERSAQLNPLQSLAGVGQTTAAQLGQAGQTMATNVGQAGGQAAQARASGYMGQANALSGALTSGSNLYMQGQMMNQMFPQSGMQMVNSGGFSNTPAYMVR
jgi:hypothetical protein